MLNRRFLRNFLNPLSHSTEPFSWVVQRLWFIHIARSFSN